MQDCLSLPHNFPTIYIYTNTQQQQKNNMNEILFYL